MKTFRNKISGTLEHVTNPILIEQYEKYTDVYEVVKAKEVKATTKKDSKKKSK